MNNNHNTHFYSLEEVKRTLETTKEFEDGEQIYYFIGALRYLYDEYNKQKEVLDKIKEKINEELKEGRPTAEGKPEEYLWLMGYYDACKDLNELLEGIE